MLRLERLGPYENLQPLGAGGMGEVFRARDPRLERDVAIKVLRADLASDPEGRARFEREARAVAQLNHPNIVAIYDVANADGLEYIVTELVDGEPLRALMRAGALPVRRTVELATQIADGMAAAHHAGIVHRDLKPENIMVTRDGRVKILDFGLARIAGTLVNSGATVALPKGGFATSAGMVMGTAAYMSPEQARGLETDYRSDQFSFGSIVYEMVSGKQAFEGASAVDTMAAIVRDEPQPLDGRIPVILRWIVERCLEKEPPQRFESTRDLYQQLRTLRDHYSEAVSSSSAANLPASEAVAATRATGKRPGVWLAGASAILLIGAAVAWWLQRDAGINLGSYKLTPIAGDDVSIATRPVWSPDGKAIAYVDRVGDTSKIFVRQLASPTPDLLTDDPRLVRLLGWSADRAHLLYIVSNSLNEPDTQASSRVMSVALSGGSAEEVMDLGTPPLVAGALSPDGKTLAVLQSHGEIWDVYLSSPLGSQLQRFPNDLIQTKALLSFSSLRFSPDGKSLLVLRTGANSRWEGILLPIPAGSGTPHKVLPELTDLSVRVTADMLPDNKHVIFTSLSVNTLLLGTLENDKSTTIYIDTVGKYWPTVSPDGSRLLFTEDRVDTDIISASLTDGTVKPLVVSPRREENPYWARKANLLAYVTDRRGVDEIWMRNSDGEDYPVISAADTPDQTARVFNVALSPDGKRVAYQMRTGLKNIQAFVSSTNGGTPVPLLAGVNATAECVGDWSPDGRELVIVTGLSLEPQQLRVVHASGSSPGQVIADIKVGNPSTAAWSPDGKWISYLSDDGWHIVSPDGTQNKLLGRFKSRAMTFSLDSRLLYGVEDVGGRAQLFSLDIETLQRRTIADMDLGMMPDSTYLPGYRVTLSPDGKSLAWAISHKNRNLWMLQGFPRK